MVGGFATQGIGPQANIPIPNANQQRENTPPTSQSQQTEPQPSSPPQQQTNQHDPTDTQPHDARQQRSRANIQIDQPVDPTPNDQPNPTPDHSTLATLTQIRLPDNSSEVVHSRPMNTRANILIATLNIKGCSSSNSNIRQQISKWADVHRFVCQKQISILCLQETHLEQTHVDSIASLYGRRLDVYNSALPSNLGASAGVALMINKERLHSTTITTTEIIPGRALLLTIKWNGDNTLTILNVYAPNSPQNHPAFWATIQQKLTDTNSPHIDLLIGDFNITEDLLDRAPTHPDNYAAREALREFRETLDLQDQWRHDNPNTHSYTFTSNTHSVSRLDRVYSACQISHTLYDWETIDSIIPSDHRMVLVRYIPPHMPFIGPGRWSLPLMLLSNNKFLDQISACGMTLQAQLDMPPTTPTEPQRLRTSFKKEIGTLAKRAGKVQLDKIRNKIIALTCDINQLEQNENLDSDPKLQTNLALLRHELQHLEGKQSRNAKAKAQAQWFAHGERLNKYWTKTNSPRKLRDVIYALHNPSTGRLTTKSSKMAEIAQQYHNELQQKELLEYNDPARSSAQLSVLSQIPDNQKLNTPDTELCTPLSTDQTHTALLSSKNGTATGLDGLPYELWKTLLNRHDQLSKANSPSFNIVKCLTTVYNNIQTHGMDPDSDFSIEWMCPLYKKKDKTRIENYCPITLLNTNYKVMTKALTMQLAKHACQLLHPDQSGFIPSRSIFNPICLAETISAYVDYMEEDGAIVAPLTKKKLMIRLTTAPC